MFASHLLSGPWRDSCPEDSEILQCRPFLQLDRSGSLWALREPDITVDERLPLTNWRRFLAISQEAKAGIPLASLPSGSR